MCGTLKRDVLPSFNQISRQQNKWTFSIDCLATPEVSKTYHCQFQTEFLLNTIKVLQADRWQEVARDGWTGKQTNDPYMSHGSGG